MVADTRDTPFHRGLHELATSIKFAIEHPRPPQSKPALPPKPYEEICYTLDGRGKLVLDDGTYRILFLANGHWWRYRQWSKYHAMPIRREGKPVAYRSKEWMLQALHSEEFRDKRRRVVRPITLRIVP